MADGEVVIVSAVSDAGDLNVRRGDPWHGFPAATAVVARPTTDAIETIAVSPDATTTAVARLSLQDGLRTADSTTAVLVVDNRTGTARTVSNREPATKMVFSADGRQLAFGEYPAGRDAPMLVVATADGGGERTFAVPGDFTLHVAWSADGKAVLTGGGSVQRIDATSAAATTLIPLDPQRDPTNTDPDLPATGGEQYTVSSNAG